MIRVAFVVNGSPESAMGQRASAFAERLADRLEIHTFHRGARKVESIVQFLGALRRLRPDVVYVFDMGYSGILATALYKAISRAKVVVDTGDVIYELARSMGERGAVGLALTRALERLSLRIADRVVVRGTMHRELLAKDGVDALVVQDGVDTSTFTPEPAGDVRAELGLDGLVTIGVLGSSVWNERLQMCYGWELVETLRLLDDLPVAGVMIGGGNGIDRLKALSREYAIEDRVRFLGYVDFDDLPRHLNALDLCISTQTNDVVGSVRTTGKLPLYLATGRYVLASDVGEASLVLPPEMRVEYVGVRDDGYPARLATRIREIVARGERISPREESVAIARERFEYDMLAKRVGDLVESLGGEPSRTGA